VGYIAVVVSRLIGMTLSNLPAATKGGSR